MDKDKIWEEFLKPLDLPIGDISGLPPLKMSRNLRTGKPERLCTMFDTTKESLALTPSTECIFSPTYPDKNC